ncbi:type III secretion protein HrpZ [Pseudomonas sp. NPDC090202]|uniref:type III secretion protein HrpZ n=1 Tax=unclassified Pseudomonas TaxID=196821 RepID=UPI003818BDB7
MLSLNTLNPLQGLRIGTVMPTDPTGGTQGSQSLKDVIDKLASALTKDGHLDKDTPLGQMVSKQMEKMNPLASLGGGSPEMIKAALGELIKDKLGDNFGAAAEFGLGGGAGKPDLMSQVLNGLGKASLDDLLSKQGDGTKFSASDMPLLDKIAEFMDQNPSKFPAPDSGSWKNELKEDNYLDSKETGAFRAALDLLGEQLGQNQNGIQDGGGLGNGLGGGLGNNLGNNNLMADPSGAQPAAGGNVAQDLGQLLGDLLQKGMNASFGNGVGNNVGGGLGTPVNNTALSNSGGNSVTQDLGQLLGGLIGKGLEASQAGNGNGNVGGGQQLFAQHDLQSSLTQAAGAIVSALLGAGHNQLS